MPERLEGIRVGAVVTDVDARSQDRGRRSRSTATPFDSGTGGRISSTLRPQ